MQEAFEKARACSACYEAALLRFSRQMLMILKHVLQLFAYGTRKQEAKFGGWFGRHRSFFLTVQSRQKQRCL